MQRSIFSLSLLLGLNSYLPVSAQTRSSLTEIETPDVQEETIKSDGPTLKLALGRVFNTRNDTILEPYMIGTNATSTRRLIHQTLSLIEPQQQGAWGVVTRLGYVGLDYYLEYLVSVSAHELGHYGEMQVVGLREPRLDIGSLWLLGFGGAGYQDSPMPVRLSSRGGGIRALQQDTGFAGTSQEKMAISGRGDVLEILLSREILKEVRKRNERIQYLEAFSYFWNHGKPLKLVGTYRTYGSIDILNAGAESDLAAYNRYSLFHRLFPYPLEDSRWGEYPQSEDVSGVVDELPADIQRPAWPGGEVALYNYFLMRDYLEGRKSNKDPHQIGIRVFNVIDPYTLTSLYVAGRYLINGKKDEEVLPRWVPQFNGYLAVPGPQYGLAWYIPTVGEALLNIEMRLGISPELAGAVEIKLEDLAIPHTKLWCSVGGEFIFQNDGTPVKDHVVGGTVSTELTAPIWKKLRAGFYHLYQSEGVWSPYKSGLRSNQVLGVTFSTGLF